MGESSGHVIVEQLHICEHMGFPLLPKFCYKLEHQTTLKLDLKIDYKIEHKIRLTFFLHE